MTTETVEYIRYRIPEDRSAEFLSAYTHASVQLAAAPQCVDYELARCEEDFAHFVLRITWTSTEDHLEGFRNSELFPDFLDDPALRRRNIFAYIDVRDLGQMVQRCLETDGLGYEVFNVANADMSVAATTDEVIQRFYDGVEVRREMGRDETFYAIDKARELVGFEPQHSWRDVLDEPPRT
jgi:nucleoside-diphosphate-sugar epimerase